MEWRRQQARNCRDERERERTKSLRPKGGELTVLGVRKWKEHEEEWVGLVKRLQSTRYVQGVCISFLGWRNRGTVRLSMGLVSSQILSHHIPWPPSEENIITSTARTVSGAALELSCSSWKSEVKKAYRRAVTRWHPGELLRKGGGS